MGINPNQPAVSASYLRVIFEALETLGLNDKQARSMRKNAGISEILLNSPESFLNIQQYEKLVSNAIQHTKEPALGLYVGQFFEVGTHGALSYAALGMPTIWECLKLGEKFARLRSPILKVNLNIEGDEAVISFDTDAFAGKVYQFVIEGGICSYYAMINLAFDNKSPSSTIKVRYKNPFDGSLNEYNYQKQLIGKISFSQNNNEIRLPRASVDKPLNTANPKIAKELEEKINSLLKDLENQPLENKIKYLVNSSIGFMPSQKTIAQHLNMSTRTLRRKLTENGQSFQKIVNKVRQESATSYLENTDWRIEEIAYVLGFSSASHFSNSYKLWTGLAPHNYRIKINSAVPRK